MNMMKRKDFIKTCGCALVSAPVWLSLLQSCTSYYYASYSQNENKLIVPLSEFGAKNNKNRDFVLLDSEISSYPICIFKTGTDHYTASLMQCTHKGCELNIEGDMFSCPCHGSEFTKTGDVIEGPAIDPLKTFKTTIDNHNIYVHIS